MALLAPVLLAPVLIRFLFSQTNGTATSVGAAH